MARLAVDIVLLPDETMTDRAIRANQELVERFAGNIVLDKNKCLPHISLAMGCIDERDIRSIGNVLETLAATIRLGELVVCGILTSSSSRGETVSVFEVENTQELQKLHETVMSKLSRFFGRSVTEEMIYGNEEVAETTLEWIRNYREKAAFDNFRPHITLGYGELKAEQRFPVAFAASKLALCHLGNHCTCRRVLASVDL